MITFDEQMQKVQEFTTRADFDPSIRLQFAPMIGTLKRAYDAEILAYEKRLHELEERLNDERLYVLEDELKEALPATIGTVVEKKVDEDGVTVTAVLTDKGKKYVEGILELEEPAKPKPKRTRRKKTTE